jgi:hypothetical protein
MRIAQFALVVMVVVVGLLGYTKPATGFSTRSDFPTPASTVAATRLRPLRCTQSKKLKAPKNDQGRRRLNARRSPSEMQPALQG